MLTPLVRASLRLRLHMIIILIVGVVTDRGRIRGWDSSFARRRYVRQRAQGARLAETHRRVLGENMTHDLSDPEHNSL